MSFHQIFLRITLADFLGSGQALIGGYKTATTADSLVAFLMPPPPAVVAPVVAKEAVTSIISCATTLIAAYASALILSGAGKSRLNQSARRSFDIFDSGNTANSDGSIWVISSSSTAGDAQPLSAVYQNSNGGIVSPITFFVVGSVANSVRFVISGRCTRC